MKQFPLQTAASWVSNIDSVGALRDVGASARSSPEAVSTVPNTEGSHAGRSYVAL